MPNQPRTPNRVIRVDGELWEEFGQACEAEGLNRAEDLRTYMQRKVRRWKSARAKSGQDQSGEKLGKRSPIDPDEPR